MTAHRQPGHVEQQTCFRTSTGQKAHDGIVQPRLVEPDSTGRRRPSSPLEVPRAWYAYCVFGEILWTEDSESHISRHGITPLEVEQVLYTRPRLAVQGRDGVMEVLGTSVSGRYLLVVVAQAGDARDFVVTARDMTDSERRLFRRKGH